MFRTQPLKIIFTHNLNDEYVKRHNFNIYPDTDLSREYLIENNILYLETNEVELEKEYDISDNYDITKKNYENLSLDENDLNNIKEGFDDTYTDDETDSDDDSNNEEESDDETDENIENDDMTEEERILDLETGKLEEMNI